MSVIQSGISQPTVTKISFINCQKIEDSTSEQGGVFYVNQPYINITLDKVSIKRPLATSGAVAHIERALQFEILNSKIEDITANTSSLMFSQSDQFNLRIFRSSVICDTRYIVEEKSGLFKQEKVTFNSTNTFFLAGTQETQVTIQESSFKFCGNQEDGGIFRMEGKVNFTDLSSTYEFNSAIEGGVFSCSGCNITLVKSKLHNN